MTELLIRYAHFLAIIVFASLLVAEHILVKAELSATEIRRVALFDAIYGISALAVLLAGLALWLWVGKPAQFYTQNPVFHAKLTAFVVMALFSILPTIFFIRNRNATGTVLVPKRIINCIRVELLMLVLIPLLAVFMAQGYGLPS